MSETAEQPDLGPGKSGFWGRNAEPLALALLFVVVAGIHLAWVWKHQAPMRLGDSYLYLIRLFAFLDGLGPHASADWWSSLGHLSHQGRPPLYQLLTAPFLLLFGRSEDAALSVNILFMAVLLIATYNVGRLSGNGRAGLLAAFLVVTYPPIVQISRTYEPLFALPACVALSLWLLLLTLEKRSIKLAWLFGASLAFGLLIHPRFVWVSVVPTTVFGTYMVLFQTDPKLPRSLGNTPRWLLNKARDPFVLFGLLPGALIALGMVLPWYFDEGVRLLDVRQAMYAPEMADVRGEVTRSSGFPGVKPDLWWYARTAPGAISNVLAAFAAVGVVFAIVKRRASTSVLLVALVAAYLLLSREMSFRSWRNFALVLPLVAALSAAWIAGLRRTWLFRALAAVCIAVGAFNFSFVTWGDRAWNRSVAVALGSPLSDDGTCRALQAAVFCPAPAQVAGWPTHEIVQKILEDESCQRGRPCEVLNIMGIPSSIFNFYLTQNRLAGRLRATSLGVKRLAHPYNLQGFLKSHYVLYHDADFRPDRGSYEVATVRFLRSPPSAFETAHQMVGTFDFPEGKDRKLLKRVKPLSADEAAASIAALELHERYKNGQHALMTELYLAEKRLPEAIAAYQRIPDERTRSQLRRLLAREYRSQGRFEEAIPLYRDALAANPEDLHSRVHLARAYGKAGNVDAAAAEFEKAIAQAPDNPWPRELLAKMYLSQGNRDQALAVYREILQIRPDYAPAQKALARFDTTGSRGGKLNRNR